MWRVPMLRCVWSLSRNRKKQARSLHTHTSEKFQLPRCHGLCLMFSVGTKSSDRKDTFISKTLSQWNVSFEIFGTADEIESKLFPCSDNGTCSTSEVDEQMKHVELIIYIPIFIMGIVFNLAALFVFCLCLRKWTESTIYMTSLALMDLLLLFPLPFKMHAAYHKWSAGSKLFCSVLENLYFVGIYGSIYMIMCIACDRWLAICHPFKAKQLRSPKVALVTCFLVWLVTFLAIFPVTFSFRTTVEGNFHCFHQFSDQGWSPKVIICLQVFGFLGPAIVVVCCSVHTIWTLQESGQRSSKSLACVKIIYSSLSAFLVPFTPSHLAIFLQFLVRPIIH